MPGNDHKLFLALQLLLHSSCSLSGQQICDPNQCTTPCASTLTYAQQCWGTSAPNHYSCSIFNTHAARAADPESSSTARLCCWALHEPATSGRRLLTLKKQKKRKDYAFCQLNEKPSIIPAFPTAHLELYTQG